jgi:hypothetical protein
LDLAPAKTDGAGVRRSGEITPPRIFISVDFPAPFSPMSATTSPAWTSRSTSLSATTPGNLLLIPVIRRTGSRFVSTNHLGFGEIRRRLTAARDRSVVSAIAR